MRWGIDLGGTKIECAVLDESGIIIERERLPTESEKGYDHVLNQIQFLVNTLSNRIGHRPKRLGIGTPGTVDPRTGLLRNCNALSLNHHTIREDLAGLLKIPITVSNDANCFALAETLQGSIAQGFPNAKVVFGVILGTGVGGGLVIDGKLHQGNNHVGGEWGHTTLDPNGEACYCGKRGCVETIISGTALQRYYAGLSGNARSLQEIYERSFTENDAHAIKTISRFIRYFGLAIANLINTIDPDVIVLGGGVSNLPIIYGQGIAEVEKNVFGKWNLTPIIKAELGDSAGVFGAAYLN